MSFKSWFDSQVLWMKIILALLLLIFWPIGIIVLIVYLASDYFEPKNKSIIEKLQHYIDLKTKLDDFHTKLLLQKEERILFENVSDFYEERAVRQYVSSGQSVRLMKGWWIRLGSGTAESHGELRKIDSGVLFITNKRFIFNGTFKNYNYNTNKIVTIEPFSDAIRLGVQGRQKTLTFMTNKPLLVGSALQFMQEGSIPKEAEEHILLELKLKIGEKLVLVSGEMKFDKNNYGEGSEIFRKLAQCIEIDINDYNKVLPKIPSEFKDLKLSVDNAQKIFENYYNEISAIKSKLGSSANEKEIAAEFDKTIKQKYGENALSESLNQFGENIEKIKLGNSKLIVSSK